MGSNLDRWEKDPFFLAAEEVQESADRMESTYRTLIHASKQPSLWNSEAVRTDLQTAIATTKWQLEEFERAVESSYGSNSADDTKERHHDFISAIESQISRVESSCNDNDSLGKPPRPWVRLDEGERNELELFLSGSTTPADEQQRGRRKQKVEAKDAKFSGHRRAASASADISSWKITVDDNVSPRGKKQCPPRKIPSFSGLLNTIESASKMKWQKNGYTKLKLIDKRQEPEEKLSETQPLTRVFKEKEESSRSCADDCYDKRLHGWYGAIQRQFQRSQNYMLYSRRTQMIFSVLFIVCLLALVVFI